MTDKLLEAKRRGARLFRKVIFLGAGPEIPALVLLQQRIAGALEDLGGFQQPLMSTDRVDPLEEAKMKQALLYRIEQATRDIAMALTGKEREPFKEPLEPES